MNNQQILDNAPEGATHIDGEHDFCKEGYFYWCTRRNYGDHPEAWIPDEFIVGNRSLADIRRIVELEKALATSFEFLSTSQTADYRFYEDHKHLIEEQE